MINLLSRLAALAASLYLAGLSIDHIAHGHLLWNYTYGLPVFIVSAIYFVLPDKP